MTNSRRGFTLLEVLVATAIMGVTVAGLLSGLSEAARNTGRLTQYDRAALLAGHKMDELLADDFAPRNAALSGGWSPAESPGMNGGWQATIAPLESLPGEGPGGVVVDRIQLEVWWMDGTTRRSLSLEGLRRGVLRPEDFVVH